MHCCNIITLLLLGWLYVNVNTKSAPECESSLNNRWWDNFYFFSPSDKLIGFFGQTQDDDAHEALCHLLRVFLHRNVKRIKVENGTCLNFTLIASIFLREISLKLNLRHNSAEIYFCLFIFNSLLVFLSKIENANLMLHVMCSKYKKRGIYYILLQ